MKLKNCISSITIICLSVIFGCLIILNVSDALTAPVCAQTTNCPAVDIGGDLNLSYPAGAQVRVYWNPNVTADQRAIFTQALNNWSAGNGNGVVFHTEEGSGPLYYYMGITMEAPTNPDRRGEVKTQIWDSTTGVLIGTEIIIDPAVTNPTALLHTMSHETGHTFGVGHPTNNVYTTATAMSPYNAANNGKNDDSSGAAGPTDCDKASVDAVYANGGVQHSNPGGGGGGGGGEGGGGGGEGGGGGGDEPNCGWTEVPGQCYGGVEYYDSYGVLIDEEPGYCDPPQPIYVCY